MDKVPPKSCIICGAPPFALELNSIELWKCTRCDLMWRRSFDVSLSHYTEAGGGFSEAKAKLQHRNIQDRIRTISKYVDLDGTCDVGGSKGYFVDELVKAGYKRAYGVDPNKVQIEAAQKRGTPMFVGSTEDAIVLFAQKKTRNATLFHVIEHLPSPVKNVQEIYDALPPGGHLIIETPDFGGYVFKKLNYRHKLVYEEHLFYFTFENLQQFLTNMGFSIVYAGKRDFDQYHLNVRESLFRLGLKEKKSNPGLMERAIYKFFGIFFTRLFSHLVVWSGRLNFSLVIARKNERLKH